MLLCAPVFVPQHKDGVGCVRFLHTVISLCVCGCVCVCVWRELWRSKDFIYLFVWNYWNINVVKASECMGEFTGASVGLGFSCLFLPSPERVCVCVCVCVSVCL